jgi:hypothetical protein
MSAIVAQGRALSAADLDHIRSLIGGHPEWSRWRLSRELAQHWGWTNAVGELKDMSCRQLLGRLDDKGLIQLPERRSPPGSRSRRQRAVVDHDVTPIVGTLCDLGVVTVRNVRHRDPDEALVLHLLERYHYLGYTYTIGENLRYIVRDQRGRPLAVAVWGSAALKVKPRDQWIGWDERARLQRLSLVVNNTRYLILPWVRVPHLASHLLARMTRRISADWQERYGHPVVLAETFVQVDRYPGTCYRAANWQAVGITTGRTRRDRFTTIQTPRKLVLVIPLRDPARVRAALCETSRPCPA